MNKSHLWITTIPKVQDFDTNLKYYRAASPLIHFTYIAQSFQSCPTLCDPMDYSPLGPSIHGILQARILEWVVIPFSRVSLQPKDWTQVSRIAGRFFTIWAYSLEKTLMLRKIEGKIKRELQRMRWLDSITDSMDVNLRKVQDIVKNRGAWCATVHGVAKSWTQLSDWTTARKTRWKFIM